MAFAYSPKIVTDGLVFAVDAANKKSYPGSNTTWTDLAGSNDGTLTNGPTFNSGNGGSIVFDGTDDYVTTSNFNKDSNLGISVFAWVYLTDYSTYLGTPYAWIVNKRDNGTDRQWQLFYRDGKVGVTIFNGGTTIASANGGTAFNLNEWCYVGFTTDGTNGSSVSTYHNGSLSDSATLSNDRGTGSRPLAIGTPAWNLGSDLNWYGNIAQTKIYNRALSSTEVTQNYNALKSRFGL